jgi:hypothetical protein
MGGGNPYENAEAAAEATTAEYHREKERRAARAKIRSRASEVVVAWAANGSHQVIKYVWRDAGGALHMDEISPEEWSGPMHTLYEVSRVAKATMTDLVKGWLASG